MPTFVAAAERPISPEEFERIVKGETISYIGTNGEYGAEEYLDNRRVRWSNLDGTCTEGYWYTEGAQICFKYDGTTLEDPQCWSFHMQGESLVAQFQQEDQTIDLIEMRPTAPLYCAATDVGV